MAMSTERGEELLGGVRSRVSWGPILAGTSIAFAVYFLLNLLGAAIGLSVREEVGAEGMARGAAIWSTVSVIVSLFLGGWIASRFTVGEDRTEAMLYGAILWGVTFFLLLWLVGVGLSMGFTALLTQGQGAPAQPPAVEAGISATEVTWWAFAGTLLSLVAAIGGALSGQGASRPSAATRTSTVPPVGGTTRPTAG